METTKNTQHKNVTVIFKDKDLEPIRYADAIINIDPSTNSYVIQTIIQLPLNEPEEGSDEPIQYGYFKIVERIDIDSVLRLYTLDESR